MSGSAHTPGPWEVSNGGIWGASPWNARVLLASVTTHSTMNGINSLANARVMAAGPDLLAALRDAIGALEFSRDYHNDLGNEEQAFVQDKLDAALAAIAKAEGKS